MTLNPRRPSSVRVLVLAGLVAALSGCGGRAHDPVDAPNAPDLRNAAGTIALEGGLRGRPAIGHPWFPLTPGRYADFRIRRYTVEEPSYVRATFGEPEMFFGRLATPWVYGEVPGLPVDATLVGLRQYFSIAPAGALWFHGAQNNGFMSYTEPPVRQLPARVRVGEAALDTVTFESYLPGGVPFYTARQTYRWSITDEARLDLPAGTFRAVRARVAIDDVVGPAGARIAEAALFGGGLSAAVAAKAGTGLEAAIVDRSSRELAARAPDGASLVPERGMWFARHTGMVARDYPHGPGPDVINITTYERLGEGMGPVPEPSSAP